MGAKPLILKRLAPIKFIRELPYYMAVLAAIGPC